MEVYSKHSLGKYINRDYYDGGDDVNSNGDDVILVITMVVVYW